MTQSAPRALLGVSLRRGNCGHLTEWPPAPGVFPNSDFLSLLMGLANLNQAFCAPMESAVVG